MHKNINIDKLKCLAKNNNELNFLILNETKQDMEKIEKDINNINSLMSNIYECVIKDGEKINIISDNVSSVYDNIDKTKEILLETEEYNISQNIKKKTIIYGKSGLIIGSTIALPISILFGIKFGIISCISCGIIGSLSGRIIGLKK